MQLRRVLMTCALLLPLSMTGAHAQTTTGELPNSSNHLPFIDLPGHYALLESERLCKLADTQAKQLVWQEAKALYQQAIKASDNPDAWYGLAKCYAIEKNSAKMLEAYRRAIYDRPQPNAINPESPFSENRIDRLMAFASALAENNLTDEAVAVYNFGVRRLNVLGDKPRLEVPLPEFGRGIGQRTYRPSLFQAMTRAASTLR